MYGPLAFCCWSMAPLLELPCVAVGGTVHREVHSGQSKQAGLSGSKAEVSWAAFYCVAGNLLEGCPLQTSSHSWDVLLSICIHFPMHTDLINLLSFRQLWLVKTNMTLSSCYCFSGKGGIIPPLHLVKSGSLRASDPELFLGSSCVKSA